MFFVYIIESKKDKSLYIGQTDNLEKRLNQHNEGLSEYTAKKVPWELLYFEKFQTRSAAMKRERFLKKQRNRSFYERLANEIKKHGPVVQFG